MMTLTKVIVTSSTALSSVKTTSASAPVLATSTACVVKMLEHDGVDEEDGSYENDDVGDDNEHSGLKGSKTK